MVLRSIASFALLSRFKTHALRCLLAAGAVVAAVAGSTAFAETYPSRPIRLVVPFAPGGTTDGIARIVAHKAAELLDTSIVVDNRPGAGGNVGTAQVAKAPADGYTIAMIGNSFTVNPSLYPSMPFTQDELTPIAIAASVPFVMLANPEAPFKTTEELIAYARSNPGAVNYASGGSGTVGHLGTHWFSSLAGVELNHIPYKGAGPALTDLASGQVHMMFDTLISSTPFIDGERVRPLFVTTKERIAKYSDVPTATEVGFPELSFSAWVGLVAPADTPKAVVEKLNKVVNEALADPEVIEKLAALGATPVGGSTAQASEFLKQETENWGAVVRDSGAVSN